MSYDENRISDQIEGGLLEKKRQEEESTIVYCLTDGASTCIYLDLQSLVDGLKMELEDASDDYILDTKWKITTMRMTENEIKELPEFDGF